MSYKYEVYIKDGREYFQWECDTTFLETKQAIKKDFEFSQSLLDLYYLDIDKYFKMLMRMGECIKELSTNGSEPKEVPSALIRDFNGLAKDHIYFDLLRLDWFERLNEYSKGEPIKFWYKELTRFPMQIVTIKNRMTELLEKVFDEFSNNNKSIQQKIADLYKNREFSANYFEFEPLSIAFEQIDGYTFEEVLLPKSINNIVDFFLREFVKRELSFKKCKSCGEYFPANHGNTEYCNRLFLDTGKTCREIGSIKAYQVKVESNPAIKEYNRAYKTHYARIKSKKMTKEGFQEWADKARKYRDQVMDGAMQLEDYKIWLNRW